jgi:hypothetical protein
MTGAAVIQDDLDYQQARKVWNADIGQERREQCCGCNPFRLTIRRGLQT